MSRVYSGVVSHQSETEMGVGVWKQGGYQGEEIASSEIKSLESA